MGTLSKLKEEMLKALRQEPGLQGTAITNEFPGTGKPQGLDRPILALGYAEIQVQQAGMGGLLGEETAGKRCEATLLFTLCVPRKEASPRLVGLFDALAEILLAGEGFPLAVKGLRCDPVEFDRTLGCPVLRAYAKADFWLPGEAEAGESIGEYIVRRAEI